MDCQTAQNMIGPWIDRQLEPDDFNALETHLSICAECQSTAETMRAEDADLLRAFLPARQAAHRVADQVIQSLNDKPQLVTPSPRGEGVRWMSLSLATAAGFLLATLVFQPWKSAETMVETPKTGPGVTQPSEPPIARLVVATGGVDVLQRGDDVWQTFLPDSLLCPTGSTVRTGPNTRCELKTSDDCVIRLDNQTEITFVSGRKLEVHRGQIWCRSPDHVSLQVLAPNAATSLQPLMQKGMWMAGCPSNSCVVTSVQLDGRVQVTTVKGEVDLQTPKGRERLLRGESASIVDGVIIKADPGATSILDTRWMSQLLIQKGHRDEELAGRVHELLARIGRTKLSMLYEQEIRSLGEYAVLPLIRFVQSPISAEDSARRLTAMRILSDVAPTWAISDLIGLLSDHDPETRFFAAHALQRLTGINHGRQPEQWREEIDQCQETIGLWRMWWETNQSRYPGLREREPRI